MSREQTIIDRQVTFQIRIRLMTVYTHPTEGERTDCSPATSDVNRGVSWGWHYLVKGEHFFLSPYVGCGIYFIIRNKITISFYITCFYAFQQEKKQQPKTQKHISCNDKIINILLMNRQSKSYFNLFKYIRKIIDMNNHKT